MEHPESQAVQCSHLMNISLQVLCLGKTSLNWIFLPFFKQSFFLLQVSKEW